MSDIFISYARTDYAQVLELQNLLVDGGWTVDWDKNLRPGDVWRAEIDRKIGVFKALMVVCSSAEGRTEIDREIEVAEKLRICVIPVRIADVELPPKLRELHYIDVSALTNPSDVRQRIETGLRQADITPGGTWAAFSAHFADPREKKAPGARVGRSNCRYTRLV